VKIERDETNISLILVQLNIFLQYRMLGKKMSKLGEKMSKVSEKFQRLVKKCEAW
jgi:hypothetical protein